MIDKYRLPSYEELDQANAIGISNAVIRARIDRGWDTDRTLTVPLNPTLVPQELKDKLAKIGVSYDLYRGRLRDGWSKERASTEPLNVRAPRYTEEQLKRIRESKIDRRTINGRVKRGWDFERALTEPAKYIGRGAK